MIMTPWRVQLLGGLRAQNREVVVTRFRTQKTGALLAYLAFFRQRAHPREALIDLLWPEDGFSAGQQKLRLALTSLRHQFEVDGMAAGTVLRADRNTVQLNPDALITDVAEFEAAFQAAEQAQNRLEKQQFLKTAVETYRGELLPGYYDAWILPQQLRLEDEYAQVLLQFLALLEQYGQLSAALGYARQAVGIDPYREEIHLALMRLYSALGQPAAALQQYRLLAQRLAGDRGEHPSDAAWELAEQIRSQWKAPSSTPPLTAPESARSRPPLAIGTITFLLVELLPSPGASAKEPAAPAFWTRVQELVRQQGGYELRSTAESVTLAFGRVRDALECARACERALSERSGLEASGREASLSLRMALHTGEILSRKEDNTAPPTRAMGHTDPLALAADVLVATHGGQILCTETTAALLRHSLPADLQLRPLGVYRLRHAPLPERLFQVVSAATPDSVVLPPRAEPGYAARLPLQLTRFIGRVAEQERMQEMVQAGARLVTLTGMGGSGKTRLAIEFARRLVEPLRGSVWFIPLANITDPLRIVPTLAQALGLPDLPGGEPWEPLVEALERQPALLVLDNFEQLLTASGPSDGVAVIRSLLERVPTLTCLVTSRTVLGLAGEQEIPVAPLAIPPPDTTLEVLLAVESVQLFVDRARTARPDFQVTSANASAVGALCCRLEGLPLALELVAARAQVLSPAQMLGHLAERLDFFVSRQKEGTARHRSLRAAIAWSYHLLSADLQRFFARLSVFRGGWTAAAAAVVCEEPSALDALEELCQHSLVVAEEVGEEMRFRMLEMLREYAHEQLSPAERAETQGRHRDYFLAQAEEIAAKLQGPEQAMCLDWLEREHDNMRAALDWCLEEGKWEEGDTGKREQGKGKREEEETANGDNRQSEIAERGLRLAFALCRFWQNRGYLREGRERFAALLALPGAAAITAVRANALAGASALAYRQGDYAAAIPLDEESLAIWQALGDRKEVAYTLNKLGLTACGQGDMARAYSLYEQALTVLRELGDSRGVASLLCNLGLVALAQDEMPAARAYLRESVTLFQTLGDAWNIALAQILLVRVELALEDMAAVTALLKESLTRCQELKDQRLIAYVLENHAVVAKTEGQFRRAAHLWAAGEAIREEIGAPLPPAEREANGVFIAETRTALGEEAFTAAWAEGRTMSLEQALRYAREGRDRAEV